MRTVPPSQATVRAKARAANVMARSAIASAVVLLLNIILTIFVISNPVFTLSLAIVAGGLTAFTLGIHYTLTKLEQSDEAHQDKEN